MGNVLAFCEFSGRLRSARARSRTSRSRAHAAQAHGGEVDRAARRRRRRRPPRADAAKYAPKVVVVEDGKLAHYLAETYAPILARLAKENNATVVVGDRDRRSART